MRTPPAISGIILKVLWRKALQAIWWVFGWAEHFVRFKSYKSSAAGAIFASPRVCNFCQYVEIKSDSILLISYVYFDCSLNYLINCFFLFFLFLVGVWKPNLITYSWPVTCTVPPASFVCLLVDWHHHSTTTPRFEIPNENDHWCRGLIIKKSLFSRMGSKKVAPSLSHSSVSKFSKKPPFAVHWNNSDLLSWIRNTKLFCGQHEHKCNFFVGNTVT